ncbi:Calx-beta domain protein [Polystyrenella longa]|uniref:Calx-beta domain protein n=1 Tax=Polystyrenella longa TaxID=2528007 RepID=A0A518CS42_9PLAN|nr:Calx-beta domain-containing protein [Polystyrenella longa]QDU82036.1 Calx-beta domain protein [Polystyrenella longa]
MRISPWYQLTNRFFRAQSQHRRKNTSIASLQIEQLEDKVMLSADMASFFGLESTEPVHVPITISYPDQDHVITEDGREIHFDPLVEVNVDPSISAIPGDGTFWEDFEAYDTTKAFELSSNPGSNHTIYLDFDGHTTTDTAWNTFANMETIESPAYDFDGDNQTFSEAEKIEIIKIWARVAEDFAPFNVNVTTMEPLDLEDLKNAEVEEGVADFRWGVRVVIGDDAMNTGAGGIAYLESFNDDIDIPVFAFNGQYQFGSNVAAMTISHEVGHALGLEHDGTSDLEYYPGHGGTGATSWGPLMGAPFRTQVTQWSKGEYFDSSNGEDDLTVITTENGFGYYPDDYGNDFFNSYNLIRQGDSEVFGDELFGIISQTDDSDMFSFWAGPGQINFDVAVPSLGGGEPGAANLDVLAILYNENGQVVQLFNDPSTLNSTFSYELAAGGLYYLEIIGVGLGVPLDENNPNGYTEYGSLGNYRISAEVQPYDNVSVILEDIVVSEHEGTASFEVSLNYATQEDVILELTTSDGTAINGRDYRATTTQIRIPAGTTSGTTTFNVPIINDLISETVESFNVYVSRVIQGDIDDISDVARGIILDNDDPLTLILDIDKNVVGEQEGPRAAKAVVIRNGDLTEDLTVQVINSDDTEIYAPKTLFFPVGVDTVEFDIETVNDGAIDGDQLDVTLFASAPNFSSVSDTIDVRDDDVQSKRTLGGHLYEPITPFNNYEVLLDIIVDSGRTLQIQPSLNFATTLKFAPGTGLYIEGAVVANAANQIPVIFTDQSHRGEAPGPWAGVFYSAEAQGQTVFSNTTVKNAINGFTIFGTDEPHIRVLNSDIHSHVENGFVVTARNGDDINEDEVEILYSKIHNNGENGVLVSSFNTEFNDSRSAPMIEGNQIYGHSEGAGVYLLANTSLNDVNPDKAESVVAPRIFANSIENNKNGIVGKSTRSINDQNFTVVAPIAHNNLIAHNNGNAIDLRVSTVFGLLNADIINNTVVENNGIALYHSSFTDDSFSVRNNIFANNEGGIVANAPYVPQLESVMRNLLWNNDGQDWVNYPSEFGSMTTFNINRTPSDPEKNISGDPMFVAPGNFRVSPNSIALNAGTRFEDDPLFGGYEGVEAPKTDYFGDARDVLRDIGFHEASNGSFPLIEDFEDGSAQLFLPYDTSDWGVEQGPDGNLYYQADTSGFAGLGLSLLGLPELPQTFEFSVEMTAKTGVNRWYDGFVVFDYKNPNDFKYAGMLVGQNEWVIGHYQGNWSNRYVTVDWDASGRKILRERTYAVHVRIDGNQVQLSVDGERIASTIVGSVTDLNKGRIGLANNNAETHFDNFKLSDRVYQGRTIEPIDEQFDVDFDETPVIPPNFKPTNPAVWSAIEVGEDVMLESNSSAPIGNKWAIAFIEPNGTLPVDFEISARISTQVQSGSWQDGFIIFDYKNPNDFKYAGMFTGQNQWVIGHYQGNFGNRLALVDWDDQGRSINVGQEYDVKIEVRDNNIKLIVNNEAITTATVANSFTLNQGKIGLGAYNARTRYDDVRVREIPPIPSSSPTDEVFAGIDFFYFDEDDDDDEKTFASGRNKVIS